LLAATAEQGLEGIVAKRLGSRYTEGKRSASWVKTKHRRRERLVVTGWRELGDGRLPEFMLARRGLGDSLRPAGSASLDPDSERRGQLIDALREHELPGRRGRGRSSVRWVVPGPIEVTADSHGRPDGPVRDAVLREVHVPSNGSSAPRTQDSAKSS
jgi:ATP-dependent DNA ligase